MPLTLKLNLRLPRQLVLIIRKQLQIGCTKGPRKRLLILAGAPQASILLSMLKSQGGKVTLTSQLTITQRLSSNSNRRRVKWRDNHSKTKLTFPLTPRGVIWRSVCRCWSQWLRILIRLSQALTSQAMQATTSQTWTQLCTQGKLITLLSTNRRLKYKRLI